MFSLFLSTSGNFCLLSLDIKSEVQHDPIPSYQIDWITHLGRPLYVPFIHCHENMLVCSCLALSVLLRQFVKVRTNSHFDGLPEEDREGQIIDFAKQKLLNGKDFLTETDISGSLACLATRFGLEFNEDEDSRRL